MWSLSRFSCTESLGETITFPFLRGVPHGMGLTLARHPLAWPSFYVSGNPHGCFLSGDPPLFCVNPTILQNWSFQPAPRSGGSIKSPYSSFRLCRCTGLKNYLPIILLVETHTAHCHNGQLVSNYFTRQSGYCSLPQPNIVW